MWCLERMFQGGNGQVGQWERMAIRFSNVEMTDNLEKSSFPKVMGSEARLGTVNRMNSNKHGR